MDSSLRPSRTRLLPRLIRASTSTSQPLEVGIPVPSVSPPIDGRSAGHRGRRSYRAALSRLARKSPRRPGPQSHRRAWRNVQRFHVLRVHRERVHDGVVFRVVLANVDLRPCLLVRIGCRVNRLSDISLPPATRVTLDSTCASQLFKPSPRSKPGPTAAPCADVTSNSLAWPSTRSRPFPKFGGWKCQG